MTLNNATFSLNAFKKRAKSVQTIFEIKLKSVQKVGKSGRSFSEAWQEETRSTDTLETAWVWAARRG
jgi:hypothetical protein